MELTREMIEYLATGEMTLNEMRFDRDGIPRKNQTRIKQLAKQLLEEMDKPGVWDNAPDDCAKVAVNFIKHGNVVGSVSYTRERPKTRIDEIAEEVGIEEGKKYGWSPAVIVSAIEIAKAAILKDREEREANR